jgi:hypothetical protein
MESDDPIRGLSTLESLRGFESSRILPSVLPATSLQSTSCGFHRFEPVEWNGVATAPGNVTYPTRNFATLGPFVLLHQQANCPVCGDTHCAYPLHVAMQIGLSHPFEQRARRIVSEDSGESRSFLLIVRTPRIFTATCGGEYPGIQRSFQHIARFIYVTTTFGPS